MVELVLNADRQQAFGVEFVAFAPLVQRPHANAGRTPHFVVDAGHRQAAFLVYLHLVAFPRSEEHTSELQSLMRISYAVFCLKKKNILYIQPLEKLQHAKESN